jgi:hypothetical protein
MENILRIVIGLHSIARGASHLWGQLPRWKVVEAVAALGESTAEAVVQTIRNLAAELDTGVIPGILGPVAEGDSLVTYVGHAGQLQVGGTPLGFFAAYRGYNGEETRYEASWAAPNNGEWTVNGSRARDLARVVWALETTEWANYWSIRDVPVPEGGAEEFQRYRQLGHRFGAGHILAAPVSASVEPVEGEAMA